MKRLLLIPVLLFALACASTNGTISTEPGSASRVAIEITRAAGRVALTITLQNAGVTREDTALIMSQLRVLVDAVLDGKDVRTILNDPVIWLPLRSELVQRFGAIIALAKVQGVQLYDQASAEVIASELIDAFAAAFRSRGGVK